MLTGRAVVLGVTGGIAAYKAAYLARRLLEEGADVRVVMTDSAQRFIGRQTFSAITGHPVVDSFFDEPQVSPHTELARWADAIVIAPATTATLARLSAGISDDVLTATVLASTAPVVLAPAMHTEMWQHPATARNIERLGTYGYHIVGPAEGPLAGGDVGPGRMVEPEEIVTALQRVIDRSMEGHRVLVSAGGTREPIDPVRYIGNRSSGRMGYAIAIEASRRGAEVTLVSSAQLDDPPGVQVIHVETAAEMAGAVWEHAPACDVVVLAAAVADFRPVDPTDDKIRRAGGAPEVNLEPTEDILAGVASLESRPFLVGFAAETGSVEGAAEKAVNKGVDLLVANDVSAKGSGFGSSTNEVTVMYPDGRRDPWPLMDKSAVAARLCDVIAESLETA